MNPAHLSIVKAYLLGTLPEPDATAFEARYFADPAFLDHVRRTEEGLIRAYIGGRLDPAERQLFEGRYLREPALMRRLEEVRNNQAAGRRPRLRLIVAASLIGSAFIGVWSLTHRIPAPVASYRQPGPQSALPILQLSPGMLKGAAQARVLPEVAPGRLVEFQLELPGRTNAGGCTVILDRVEPDGERSRVWSGTSSDAAPAGYTAVAVDGRFLPPGDYVLEVADTVRQIHETYSLRIASVPHP